MTTNTDGSRTLRIIGQCYGQHGLKTWNNDDGRIVWQHGDNPEAQLVLDVGQSIDALADWLDRIHAYEASR